MHQLISKSHSQLVFHHHDKEIPGMRLWSYKGTSIRSINIHEILVSDGTPVPGRKVAWKTTPPSSTATLEGVVVTRAFQSMPANPQPITLSRISGVADNNNTDDVYQSIFIEDDKDDVVSDF